MSILSARVLDAKRFTATSLRRLNVIVAVLYLIETVGVVLWRHGAHTLPIQTNFLSQDELASQVAGRGIVSQATRHIFDLNLIYLVATFLILAAIAHLLAATYRRAQYETSIKNGSNDMRWQKYALLVGLTSATVGAFVGSQEIVLILIMGLSAAAICLVASTNEQSSSKIQRRVWHSSLGISVSIIPVLILAACLWGSYAYGLAPSAYQYGVSLLWLVYVFALSHASLGASRSQKQYLPLERSYIVLNFVGLSGVAWLIAAGL